MAERFREGSRFESVAGYARAVRAGNRILVSGTADLAADGAVLHPDDTYGQTAASLRRGVAAVETLGGSVADVVRTRVYLGPGASWRDAARAHKDVLGTTDPANTLLYVAGFPVEGALVEIELDAEVGSGAGSAAPGVTPPAA